MKRLSYSILLLLLFDLIIYADLNRIRVLMARSRLYSDNSETQQLFARSALKGCRSKHVKQHAQMLSRAWQLFAATQGFDKTWHHITRQKDNADGHLFEIETALNATQHAEQVVAFNRHIPSIDDTTSKEFDLITIDSAGKRKFIECKTGNWRSNKKKQFIEQANIVHGYHEQGMPAYYIVASKKPMCPKWKRWFRKNHILYTESR